MAASEGWTVNFSHDGVFHALHCRSSGGFRKIMKSLRRQYVPMRDVEIVRMKCRKPARAQRYCPNKFSQHKMLSVAC